ncbi:hypothetical protein MCOR31_012057, partial [Pyricularia oryzae]
LAMSIEDVVLGHLRLQMLGEKERPRSPSRSPPKTDQGSPADSRAGKATVPGAANRSWATVAASAAISARAATTTPSKGGSTPPPPVRKQPDHRVLIRTHQPGLDPREPFALRRKTTEAVGVTLAEIPAIMRTPTGWAIRAANATIKDKLLKQEHRRKLKGFSTEPLLQSHKGGTTMRSRAFPARYTLPGMTNP